MKRSSWLLASVALGATFSLAAPARAQEAVGAQPAPAVTPGVESAEPDDEARITVTGSRVIRDGFQAPTPTTVLTADALDDRGLTNVGDFLNEIPSFRPSVTNQTNTQSSNLSGATFADLGFVALR